ncbi:acyl-CoA N-acyltransferase [Apiospora phragmitis]|uniref:Acyl-CoA N-acyltransferase n=1 Tax=Apiospora phragmitis TaxID=2905665 RepID=A0ABR1W6E6_9PEZI
MASHPAISATSFPALSSLTYEQLQQLYVKNKAELTKHVNEAVGVEEKFYGGHDWFVRWWESPPPHVLQQRQQHQGSTNNNSSSNSGGGGGSGAAITNLASSNLAQDHNGLEHQIIPASELSEAINMVKNRFRRRLQRFNWVTGPHRQPDLERALESSGFSCQEEEPVMCADLTATNTAIATPAASLDGSIGSSSSSSQPPLADLSAAVATATHSMRRHQPHRQPHHPPPSPAQLPGLPAGVVIESTSSLGIVGWVSAWAHGAPECDVLHWTKVYARVATSVYRDQFRMFAARLRGGEYIGTGYLHCHSGIASIHSLFVHPAHRRRGIGKALAAYAMQDARALGYQVATLTATGPAMGLLTKLGFKEFGAVKLYTWYPVVVDNNAMMAARETMVAAREKAQRKKLEAQHPGVNSKERMLAQEVEAMEKMKELRIKEAEEEGWELV